jgi:hypothetical protein
MNGAAQMPKVEHSARGGLPSRGVLIAEAENRLQFNVFVSIFFCTLLYSFFRSVGRDDVPANTVLVHWAAVPALHLLSYVFFEYGRAVITDFWLKRVNALLLVCSALFVLPMILMAAIEAKWYRFELWLGILSLWGIAILALLLIVPIVVGIGAGLYAGWWGGGNGER